MRPSRIPLSLLFAPAISKVYTLEFLRLGRFLIISRSWNVLLLEHSIAAFAEPNKKM